MISSAEWVYLGIAEGLHFRTCKLRQNLGNSKKKGKELYREKGGSWEELLWTTSSGGKLIFSMVMVSHWQSSGSFSVARLFLGKEKMFLSPAGVIWTSSCPGTWSINWDGKFMPQCSLFRPSLFCSKWGFLLLIFMETTAVFNLYTWIMS